MSGNENSESQSQTDSSNTKDSKKGPWEKFSPLLLSLLAVAGGVIGSYLSGTKLVESTKIPAMINAKLTCENDINADENKFRERSAKFLSSVASFDADTSLYYHANNNQLRDPAKNVITQSSEISSFSNEKLSSLATNIADSVKTIAGEELNGGDQYAARKVLASSRADWQPAFNEHIKSFDAKREKCKIDYLFSKPAS